MPIDVEAVRALRETLGLTAEQARAYWYLVTRRQGIAHELSESCHISRGRIYEVLKDLEERGLVGHLPTAPTIYRPLDPESAMKSAEKRFLDLAKDAAATRLRLMTSPPLDAPSPHSTSLVITGRRAVIKRLDTQMRSAAHSLHVLMSEAFVARNQTWLVPLLRAKSRDLDSVFVLLKRTAVERTGVAFSARDLPIRWTDLTDEGIAMCIVDRSRYVSARSRPIDFASGGDEDYAFESTDGSVARLFAQVVERLWEAGPGPGGTAPATSGHRGARRRRSSAHH